MTISIAPPATSAPPGAWSTRTVTCGGGAYVREATGAWRYAWGDPVPQARDLTVTDVLSVAGDPLDVADQLQRELSPEVRELLVLLRDGNVRNIDLRSIADLRRRLGALVCGLQAPELLGHALLDASQLARRLRVTRETIDSYRTRGRLPEPTIVRGRTPLWSAPVVRRWQSDRRRC